MRSYTNATQKTLLCWLSAILLGKTFLFNMFFVSNIVLVCWSATTHTDLVLRAHERGVKVKTIHNASIMNAVGCCGLQVRIYSTFSNVFTLIYDWLFKFFLQLYSFGETVSIVLWTESWRPQSFFDKIERNRKLGFHTLCLLGAHQLTQQLIDRHCPGK